MVFRLYGRFRNGWEKRTQIIARFLTTCEKAGRLTDGRPFHQASSLYILFKFCLYASQRILLTSCILCLPCACTFSMSYYILIPLPAASSHTMTFSLLPWLFVFFLLQIIKATVISECKQRGGISKLQCPIRRELPCHSRCKRV